MNEKGGSEIGQGERPDHNAGLTRSLPAPWGAREQGRPLYRRAMLGGNGRRTHRLASPVAGWPSPKSVPVAWKVKGL